MKTKTLLAAILVALAATALPSRAADQPPAPPKQTQEAKRTIVNVGELFAFAKQYKGERIVVVGKFMSLYGKCDRPAPVSGSIWMIQDTDNGACIYAQGPVPEGYSTRTSKGIGKMISVECTIARGSGGRYYLSVYPPPSPPRNNQPPAKPGAQTAPAPKQDKPLLSPTDRQMIKKQQTEATKPVTVSTLFSFRDYYHDRKFFIKGLVTDEKDPSCARALVSQADIHIAYYIKDLDNSCVAVAMPPDNDNTALPRLDQPISGSLTSVYVTPVVKITDTHELYYMEMVIESK